MQKEKIDFEKLDIKSYNPMQKLLDKRFTIEAIFECLSNGDVKGAEEVFENYIWAINKGK
jgi:hypothetical protein